MTVPVSRYDGEWICIIDSRGHPHITGAQRIGRKIDQLYGGHKSYPPQKFRCPGSTKKCLPVSLLMSMCTINGGVS
jgi:hypothetical protein